jgi:enoyl-CoA hydratase
VPDDQIEFETNKLADQVAKLPIDGIVMGKAQWEAALDAVGLHQGYHQFAFTHSLQADGIHFEPGEFSLFREVRNRGMKGAIQAQKDYFGDGDTW